MARTSETGYLKIVAPWQGSAPVEQQGRQACARAGGWVIYDTTGSYAIANPERSRAPDRDAAQGPDGRARRAPATS